MRKQRFWLYRRNGVFYLHDSQTGKRESLHTNSKRDAEHIRSTRNEAASNPQVGVAIAKALLSAHDPQMAERDWQRVMDEFCRRGKAETQAHRRQIVGREVFDSIRGKKLVETTADDFVQLLSGAGAQVHHNLRCLQNLALGFGWLPWAVLPAKLWPMLKRRPKRAITIEEHLKILKSVESAEWRQFFELLWETGASQTDAASLCAENFNPQQRILSYQRRKTGEWAYLRAGGNLERLLGELPTRGLLFPKIAAMKNSARSADFYHRCRRLGIKGISLHSYRYAWAERALGCGYPERWAQNALGHSSRAVHHAYARKGAAICPSLDDYERSPVSNGHALRAA